MSLNGINISKDDSERYRILLSMIRLRTDLPPKSWEQKRYFRG